MEGSESDDGWVDEVLELGIWVNTWRTSGTFEGAITRKGAGGLGEDQTFGHFSFLVFSLHHDTDTAHISFPRTDQDLRTDEWLGWVVEFLISGQRPAVMTDTALKHFLKQALRFFLREGNSGVARCQVVTSRLSCPIPIGCHWLLRHMTNWAIKVSSPPVAT